MRRKMILAVMIICLLQALSAAASAQEANFTEKATKVFTDGEEVGELILRFYEEMPHVPYMGMNQYSEYMLQHPLTLREEDGMFIMENPIGEQALYNAETGVMTIADWNRFFDLPLPLEDEAKGWKDTATRFVRISAVEFEGEPKTVELDFSRYGIRVYVDQDDIYLPVSILCNMMTDIALNYMVYNGENLYVQRVDLEGNSPKGFWDSEMFQAQFKGEERPEDIIRQCYADLCFDFDYFFGHPGIAILDEALAEKGLDQALTDLGSEGEELKEALHSVKLADYVAALTRLFMIYFSDGHTVFLSGTSISMEPSFQEQQSFLKSLEPVMVLLESPDTMKQVLRLAIPVQRKVAWGSLNYREHGNTAIIRLDDFMPDEEAWAKYYSGEGDFPEDCLGIVISGLRKASENPDIENIILDLSCNGGGSPDVMMAILAVTTGQTQLYGLNRLTDRKMTFTFEADTNFDGVYDEKDKEVKYDYNYGVLTTRYAFSCGNLFPIIMQEGGAVLIGESSSGGSCCVQIGTDSQGLSHMMSSAQWQLTDSQFISVERGCEIDLPIETKSSDRIDSIVSIFTGNEGLPSFQAYFNDARLDNMMNEYFQTQDEADVAA